MRPVLKSIGDVYTAYSPHTKEPSCFLCPPPEPTDVKYITPLFSPSLQQPLFPLQRQKEIIHFQPFLPASPSPSSPSQQQRGAQSSHTPQPNPNCVCVCLHFFPWHEEGNQVSILCSVPVNGSPEPFRFNEKVENLAVRNWLEFGKFVLWIYINLVWGCNGKLGISYLTFWW